MLLVCTERWFYGFSAQVVLSVSYCNTFHGQVYTQWIRLPFHFDYVIFVIKTNQVLDIKLVWVCLIVSLQVAIPADETTYWYAVRKLPDLKDKHHIIKVCTGISTITIYLIRFP
jgi:hypothetical protein